MLKISINSIKARLFDLSCSEVLEEYTGFWAYQTEDGFGISDHTPDRDNYISIFVYYDFNRSIVTHIELTNTASSERELRSTYLHTHKEEQEIIMREIRNLFPSTKIMYIPSIEEEPTQEEDYDDDDEPCYNNSYDDEDEDEEEDTIDYTSLGIAYLIRNGY